MIQRGRKVRVLTQIDADGLKEVEPYIGLFETRHVTCRRQLDSP